MKKLLLPFLFLSFIAQCVFADDVVPLLGKGEAKAKTTIRKKVKRAPQVTTPVPAPTATTEPQMASPSPLKNTPAEPSVTITPNGPLATVNPPVELNQNKVAPKTKRSLWSKLKSVFGNLDDPNQIVAIVLCWFLGGLGIHRVYMGSSPLMILWYVLTCFGFFGILTLIDFIMLIIQPTTYYNNNKLFGFVK